MRNSKKNFNDKIQSEKWWGNYENIRKYCNPQFFQCWRLKNIKMSKLVGESMKDDKNKSEKLWKERKIRQETIFLPTSQKL